LREISARVAVTQLSSKDIKACLMSGRAVLSGFFRLGLYIHDVWTFALTG
jgi:hypothetical protein